MPTPHRSGSRFFLQGARPKHPLSRSFLRGTGQGEITRGLGQAGEAHFAGDVSRSVTVVVLCHW